MKFKQIEQLVNELEKLTGDDWKLGETSLTNNASLTCIQASLLGNSVECDLEAFGGLPQNKKLSLDDFKYYLKTSGRDLKYICLVQEACLYHHNKKTDRTHFEYIINRKFPLDTKLDDGTLLINNLQNFSWKYCWKKHYLSGYHAIPSQAQICIEAKPTPKVLDFIEKQPLSKKEIIPVTHHREVFVWLEKLSEQALSNINKTSEELEKN